MGFCPAVQGRLRLVPAHLCSLTLRNRYVCVCFSTCVPEAREMLNQARLLLTAGDGTLKHAFITERFTVASPSPLFPHTKRLGHSSV